MKEDKDEMKVPDEKLEDVAGGKSTEQGVANSPHSVWTCRHCGLENGPGTGMCSGCSMPRSL